MGSRLSRPTYDPLYSSLDDFTTYCIAGNSKMVKHVLKHTQIDPTVNNNEAIKTAHTAKQRQVVLVLIQDQRVINSLEPSEAATLMFYATTQI
jgi:hypothetical protein